MVDKKEANEKKQAAASYIINFYNQVIQLNDSYSKFLNLLVELEYKYGEKDFINKADDAEKNSLIESSRIIRYVSTNAFIQYKVIRESIDKLNDEKSIKELETKYYTIRDKVIPSRNDLQDYVITLNKFLVTNIIQELLTNSSEFIDTILNN